MSTEPEFSVASWKAVCAALDVPVTTVTDAFGRTDVRIDRAGMERLRDAAVAVGHHDVAEIFNRCLNAGGTR
jgi:hypothetical protein